MSSGGDELHTPPHRPDEEESPIHVEYGVPVGLPIGLVSVSITEEPFLLRNQKEEVQGMEVLLAETGNIWQASQTNGGEIHEIYTDTETRQFDDNLVSESLQKASPGKNAILLATLGCGSSQPTSQTCNEQVSVNFDTDEREFEDDLIKESTQSTSIREGNNQGIPDYQLVTSAETNSISLKCLTDSKGIPVQVLENGLQPNTSVIIIPPSIGINHQNIDMEKSVPSSSSSSSVVPSHSTGDQLEIKDLVEESKLKLEILKGRKRKKTEEERREENRLKAIHNRKKQKLKSESKDKTIQSLEVECESLKNAFNSLSEQVVMKDQAVAYLQNQVNLKDKVIAELKKQIKSSTEVNAAPEFTPADLPLKQEVHGSVLNSPVSLNEFDKEKMNKKMRQAEIAAMNPDDFLKFMNEWLSRKRMTKIKMKRGKADALVTPQEHEKWIKIEIIKRYRAIKHEKDRFENVREDLLSNGLA